MFLKLNLNFNVYISNYSYANIIASCNPLDIHTKMTSVNGVNIVFEYPVFPSNVLPRKSATPGVIKMWQRLCACMAAFKTYETEREKNDDKYAKALQYYSSFAQVLVDSCAEFMPFGLTVATLMSPTRTPGINLTGEQVWTMWEDVSRTVKADLLPAWYEVLNKDGSIPSGDTIDSCLLKTRKVLFAKGKTSSIFKDDWFPTSWLPLVCFGPMSENPHPQWVKTRPSNGPSVVYSYFGFRNILSFQFDELSF